MSGEKRNADGSVSPVWWRQPYELGDNMDHDAYMVSPDGHKPTDTSLTLSLKPHERAGDPNDAVAFAADILTGAVHPRLRTLAAAGGVDLDKLVKEIQAADVDPLGAWPFPRGGLVVDNSHVAPLTPDDSHVTPLVPVNQPVEIAASFEVKVTTGETLEQATARIIEGTGLTTLPPPAASTNGDDHVAGVGEKWAFDEKVTSVFDKMLEASIPNYQEMRRLTTNLGRKFIPGGDGVIIDIGASRGDALAPFVEKYPDNNYYAVEVSEPMRKVMQTRFLPMTRGRGPNVTICDHDLRYNHSVFGVKSDLILSVLTLMFIPIELRQRLLQSIFDSLKPGGALLLVEKCLGADSYVNDMLVEEYYSMKREHGYTAEQISRKKMALEGVLVPVTVDWNMDMLKRAGFKHIDVYWRSLMFTGFIAVKE